MTGNQSKPWHPNRKHYPCSRRENLTQPFSIPKYFIKHRSSAVNGDMFVKSNAICNVRNSVIVHRIFNSGEKITGLDCRVNTLSCGVFISFFTEK